MWLESLVWRMWLRLDGRDDGDNGMEPGLPHPRARSVPAGGSGVSGCWGSGLGDFGQAVAGGGYVVAAAAHVGPGVVGAGKSPRDGPHRELAGRQVRVLGL